MTKKNSTPASNDVPLVIDDWPMSLEVTRTELGKAKRRLERYQAFLRLANVEIEQRNRYILALTTFGYQASSVGNAKTALKLTLVQALETTNATVGAIVLVSEKKDFSLQLHRGLTPKLIDILTGRELECGAMTLMPHLVTGNGALLEYNTAEDEKEQLLLDSANLTSLVSLPIQTRSRLVGALVVGLQGKRVFKASELCFLMALSQEIAIVLESLQLREDLWQTAEMLLETDPSETELTEESIEALEISINPPLDIPTPFDKMPEPAKDDLEELLAAMMEAEDEVQQQNADLQTLNNIADQLNRTLEMREILQCAVDQTRQTLFTDAAWLYTLDDQQNLRLRAHNGLSKTYLKGMQWLRLGDGLEGQVAEQQQPAFVEAVPENSQQYKLWVEQEGLRALAVVPLLCTAKNNTHNAGQNKLVGVLAAGIRQHPSANNEVCWWSPRKMRLMTSVAHQVSLAISNARLYNKIKDQEISERTGNEILHNINDMLLEKNNFLEGVINNDLMPAMSTISRIVDNFLIETPLPPLQQKQLERIQKIVSRLNQTTHEADAMSHALDTEFTEMLTHKNAASSSHLPSLTPPRLAKNKQPVPAPPASKPADTPANKPPDEPPPAAHNPKPPSDKPVSKTLSFQEAVAAGLVPSHILQREKKQ